MSEPNDTPAARYFRRDPREGVLCMKARAICFHLECVKARQSAWVCGRRGKGDPY